MTKQYDERHGGPYDRGRADFWYGRKGEAHYMDDTPGRARITDLTPSESDAYHAGYDAAESDGGQKDWY